MIFKSGCVVWNLHPEVEKALADLGVVDRIFRELAGRHAFVTSVRDSGHSWNSYHYYGRAFDLRTKDLELVQAKQAERRLAVELGAGWYVELEFPRRINEHIHAEYRGP